MGELEGIYKLARPDKYFSSPKNLLDPVLRKFQLGDTRIATVYRPFGLPFRSKN